MKCAKCESIITDNSPGAMASHVRFRHLPNPPAMGRRPLKRKMKYEVKANGEEYRVEAIDYKKEGIVYIAIFCGPDAQRRAKQYARLMNLDAGSLK